MFPRSTRRARPGRLRTAAVEYSGSVEMHLGSCSHGAVAEPSTLSLSFSRACHILRLCLVVRPRLLESAIFQNFKKQCQNVRHQLTRMLHLSKNIVIMNPLTDSYKIQY